VSQTLQNRRGTERRLFAATAAAFLVSCSFLGGSGRTATYYAPTLRPDGEELAYLKRVSRYRSEGFLLFGQRISFSEDRLMLCRATRERRRERCVEEWGLPLVKANPSSKGDIEAQLAWEGEAIRYRIRLIRFGPTSLGVPGPNLGTGPDRLLTNFPLNRPFQASTIPSRWQVRLDRDSALFAYPIDNAIIVESTE
jgi:hypothetical protein